MRNIPKMTIANNKRITPQISLVFEKLNIEAPNIIADVGKSKERQQSPQPISPKKIK